MPATTVTLDAYDWDWKPEAVRSAIVMCFRHWSRIQIQSLSFNGRTVFDHRVPADWKPIPELTPVTAKVQMPDPKIWGGAA